MLLSLLPFTNSETKNTGITMVLKNYVAHCLITVLRKQLALEHFYIYWCIVHVLVMVKGCFLCKNDLILLIYMYKYSLLLIHVWYVDAYETNLMLCWSWFWYFYLTVYNSQLLCEWRLTASLGGCLLGYTQKYQQLIHKSFFI